MRLALLIFTAATLSACSTPRRMEAGIVKKSSPCLAAGTDMEAARACLEQQDIHLHMPSSTWARYSSCKPWLFLPLLPACGGIEITSSPDGKVEHWKSWSEIDAL